MLKVEKNKIRTVSDTFLDGEFVSIPVEKTEYLVRGLDVRLIRSNPRTFLTEAYVVVEHNCDYTKIRSANPVDFFRLRNYIASVNGSSSNGSGEKSLESRSLN